jgi:isopentenyldiphosphate isomerase
MNQHPEEYLDLVDENDQVIGKKLRADIYAEGLWNFRVVDVFLKNSKGQLWIPRRTADKAIFPLALDFSAAGHVASGETYEQTFEREVAEELNIDVSKVPYRLLGYLTPKKDGVPLFMQVYEIESDETPAYNPDDFTEYFWLTPVEVLAKIESGDYAKDHIPVLIKRFYL